MLELIFKFTTKLGLKTCVEPLLLGNHVINGTCAGAITGGVYLFKQRHLSITQGDVINTGIGSVGLGVGHYFLFHTVSMFSSLVSDKESVFQTAAALHTIADIGIGYQSYKMTDSLAVAAASTLLLMQADAIHMITSASIDGCVDLI